MKFPNDAQQYRYTKLIKSTSILARKIFYFLFI